jgi:hypothetical protein
VRRLGKDKNDVFWLIGKIHGLENIVFATEEEIKACKGNPVEMQLLMDKCSERGGEARFGSREEILSEGMESFRKYKEVVNAMGMSESDRRKLLALPLYLAKRVELPEPKPGQVEYEMFKE